MKDEQIDDVKLLNQLAQYTKVATIRDKQLAENQELENEFKNEQRKLDLYLEIERLK